MTLSEKQRKFTLMVAKLIAWAYANGFELTFGEAYRTPEQQEIYVKAGKSKTLKSKHLERLAIDVNLFIAGEYKTDAGSYGPLGEFWKSLDPDNRWGGDWGWDANHFEYAGG
ncbi:M15 family peptidase [bacterium]|nr:MAG: M15 family peptidase [bacterium]